MSLMDAKVSNSVPLRSATVHATEIPMVSEHTVSPALYVVTKPDLAAALLAGPRTAAEVATRAHVPAGPLRRLLHTLGAVALVAHADGDRFANTELYATLATGTPGSVQGQSMPFMETQSGPLGNLLEATGTCSPDPDVQSGTGFHLQPQAHPRPFLALTAAIDGLTNSPQHAVLSKHRLPPGDTAADIGGAHVARCSPRSSPMSPNGAVWFSAWRRRYWPPRRTSTKRGRPKVEIVGDQFFRRSHTGHWFPLCRVDDWDGEACVQILKRVAAAAQPAVHLVVVDAVHVRRRQPPSGKLTDPIVPGMVTERERWLPQRRQCLPLPDSSLTRRPRMRGRAIARSTRSCTRRNDTSKFSLNSAGVFVDACQ